MRTTNYTLMTPSGFIANEFAATDDMDAITEATEQGYTVVDVQNGNPRILVIEEMR
jgi:hypothetical protein